MQVETTLIRISSRASVQINNNFYTVEYGEERQIKEGTEEELDEERQRLWNLCNTEVDNQIRDIVTTFSNNHKR